MPVNMDPKKRLRKPEEEQPAPSPAPSDQAGTTPNAFGKDTLEDKEKALADAEWKNLWDATEVIDMDKW